MDTFSHALWGKAVFGYRSYKWYPALFGALPDLLSFGVYFIYRVLTNFNQLKFGKPALSELPDWIFSLYNFSHSGIISLLFIGIVYIYNRQLSFAMCAGPLHISIDFFTHSTDYFPTPILWPLSDYRFDGIPWSEPSVWFTNIGLIVLIFIYRFKYN